MQGRLREFSDRCQILISFLSKIVLNIQCLLVIVKFFQCLELLRHFKSDNMESAQCSFWETTGTFCPLTLFEMILKKLKFFMSVLSGVLFSLVDKPNSILVTSWKLKAKIGIITIKLVQSTLNLWTYNIVYNSSRVWSCNFVAELLTREKERVEIRHNYELLWGVNSSSYSLC